MDEDFKKISSCPKLPISSAGTIAALRGLLAPGVDRGSNEDSTMQPHLRGTTS
jgi:hypothetical protein